MNLTAAGWPVEYVGPHISPRYVRVRYTGQPSLAGTPCPSADTPNACSVQAGRIVSIRKDRVMIHTTTPDRFTVSAMHKPSNGFDGPTQVDYWRVVDTNTGMRAEGTGQYADRVQAQIKADSLNAPDCGRCGARNVEDAGDHADQTGHWPTAADVADVADVDRVAELAEIGQEDLGALARRLIIATE